MKVTLNVSSPFKETEACSVSSLRVLRVAAFTGDAGRITGNDVREIGPPGATQCDERDGSSLLPLRATERCDRGHHRVDPSPWFGGVGCVRRALYRTAPSELHSGGIVGVSGFFVDRTKILCPYCRQRLLYSCLVFQVHSSSERVDFKSDRRELLCIWKTLV
jgi:hypothetical protein